MSRFRSLTCICGVLQFRRQEASFIGLEHLGFQAALSNWTSSSALVFRHHAPRLGGRGNQFQHVDLDTWLAVTRSPARFHLFITFPLSHLLYVVVGGGLLHQTMASHTAQDLILEHPTNPIHNPLYMTDSDKRWARNYKPIVNATCRTMVGSDGVTYANFDEAFLPLYEDDNLRLRQPAEPPNSRKWRFETEADCENWFNTEIVNVVLSAWNRYPSILQSSHNKPPSEENIPENIDSIFTFKSQGAKRVLVIGEIKRNLIKHTIWQRGNPSSSASQKKLSQELRGYAHKYQCPQVFCFDGAVLLLLQFRAEKSEDIEKESCPVDCWVLPMEQTACPLRLAFYRLLSQGWRRCQAELTTPFTVGGLTPHSREFFNGLPVWKHEGKKTRSHPLGYQRSVHAATGALIWIRDENEGEVEWETDAFWERIEA